MGTGISMGMATPIAAHGAKVEPETPYDPPSQSRRTSKENNI